MRSKILKYGFYLGIILLMGACIDEIEVDTPEEDSLLVVEGFITTAPGPHYFSLQRSARYGSIFEGYSERVEDATVLIKDDVGNQVFLIEDSLGIYRTPNSFQAVVGRSYNLIINSKGKQYISTPEKVVPVPKIEELIPQFREDPGVNTASFTTGVDFYSRFNDPADEQNFILWTNQSVYEFSTRPDLFIIPQENGPSIPAPKDCCDVCWKSESRSSGNLFIYSDELSNGNLVTPLAYFVSDNGFRFQTRFMMILKQNSLTREAYQYYSLLKEQLEISGDIFDPPPANINGNIVNISDPDEQVIGYFHASDVDIDTMYITEDFITRKTNIQTVNDDCRVIFGASAERPDFF